MLKERIYKHFPALKYPAFACFISGQAISLVGQWMKRLAMSWLVFRLTDSAFLLGVVEFLSLAPILFLGLFAGAWLERHDLRKALVTTQILCMSVGALLTWVSFTDQATFPLLAGLSLLLGIVSAFDMTARQSSVSLMVGDPHAVKSAVALNSMAFNISKLLGPSLAGFMVWLWGESICFLLSTLAYLPIICFLAFRIRFRERVQKPRRQGLLKDMGEGLSYVRNTFYVNRMLRLFFVFGLLAPCYVVLFPTFSTYVLDGGSRTLGWLLGAVGAGAFFGGIAVSMFIFVKSIPVSVSRSALFTAASLAVFALSPWMWLSLPSAFCIGFGITTTAISVNTLLQTTTADSHRSRLLSIYVMCTAGAGPVGGLIFGALGDVVGAPAAMLCASIILIAAILFYLRELSAVRRSLNDHMAAMCQKEFECPDPADHHHSPLGSMRTDGAHTMSAPHKD